MTETWKIINNNFKRFAFQREKSFNYKLISLVVISFIIVKLNF